MTKWATAEVYKELLRDICEIDVDTIFNIKPTTDLSKLFYVEVACLNYWNQDLDQAPEEEGINLKVEQQENGFSVTFTCDKETTEPITLFYNPDQVDCHRQGLDVIYNDVLIYSRAACQNPVTEWHYNELVGKLFDEKGEPIFHGTPNTTNPDLPYGG